MGLNLIFGNALILKLEWAKPKKEQASRSQPASNRTMLKSFG